MVIMLMAAIVAVTIIALVRQRQELVRAREVVARRAAFCDAQRSDLSALRDRIATGVARVQAGSPSAQELAELETANRMFHEYTSLDQVLTLCGTYDEVVTRKLIVASFCWGPDPFFGCFQDAAQEVVRALGPVTGDATRPSEDR